MSRHDPLIRLLHMRDHAREAVHLSQDRTREDLTNDRLLNLALVRLLEIVGEAASRVGASTREKVPGIPWPDVVGMRHRIIHGYDKVDLDLVWKVIKEDLPPLIEALEQFLGDQPG